MLQNKLQVFCCRFAVFTVSFNWCTKNTRKISWPRPTDLRWTLQQIQVWPWVKTMFGRNRHERPSKTNKSCTVNNIASTLLRLLLSWFFSPELILFSLLVVNALCIMIILQEKFTVPLPLFGSTSTRLISRYFSLLHHSWQPRAFRPNFLSGKNSREKSVKSVSFTH